MLYLVDPDALLLSIFLVGALLWISATIGPSLRLCACRPQLALLANRVMLLRGNDEVVGIYVLNYALLLVWGVSSVMVEAAVGVERRVTSVFSAFMALAIGIVCAGAHAICPLERRRRQRAMEAKEAAANEAAVGFKSVVACMVQLPDGSSALAVCNPPVAKVLQDVPNGRIGASAATTPCETTNASDPVPTSLASRLLKKCASGHAIAATRGGVLPTRLPCLCGGKDSGHEARSLGVEHSGASEVVMELSGPIPTPQSARAAAAAASERGISDPLPVNL